MAARPGLMRSREHRLVLGVLGGVAEWLGWDPNVLRVVFVLVSVCSAAFPGLLVYAVLAILMPLRPEA